MAAAPNTSVEGRERRRGRALRVAVLRSARDGSVEEQRGLGLAPVRAATPSPPPCHLRTAPSPLVHGGGTGPPRCRLHRHMQGRPPASASRRRRFGSGGGGEEAAKVPSRPARCRAAIGSKCRRSHPGSEHGREGWVGWCLRRPVAGSGSLGLRWRSISFIVPWCRGIYAIRVAFSGADNLKRNGS